MKDFETIAPHFTDDKGGKILFPFGPPIYQNFISDELKESLLKEAKLMRDQDKNFNEGLAGNMFFGGSYNYSIEYFRSIEPQFRNLLFGWFDWMKNNFGHKRVTFGGMSKEVEISLDNMWVNFQHKYDHNPIHQHNGIVSFVAYLKLDTEIFKTQAETNTEVAGRLSFHHGEQISPLTSCSYDLEPQENLILFFPSTLNHIAYPYWIDGERISISGNFSAKGVLNINGMG